MIRLSLVNQLIDLLLRLTNLHNLYNLVSRWLNI